ncbi:MAG: hypothetical protein AB8G26_18165 [Ilumatobacter sp.]
MSHHLADVYRHRARRLRELADDIHHTPALRLHLHAGDDTWRGPRALASVADLRRAQVEVEREVHLLRVRADRFEREADRLDALAHATAG